jgi:hypothetical protein
LVRVETKADFWIFAKSENLTKLREISFHENIGIPNIFAEMLTKIFVFKNIFAKIKTRKCYRQFLFTKIFS